MRANVRTNIELAAQVVIAAGVLVKRNVWPGAATGSRPSISAGERLNIPNVDWAQNKKSVVFF